MKNKVLSNSAEITYAIFSAVILAASVGTYGFVGCGGHVVRDASVFRLELSQYENWAVQQALLLKEFTAEHCACDEFMKFTTVRCQNSADYILTVEARAAWHRDMSLYNASLLGKRPPKVPPVIPVSSTLCTSLVPASADTAVTPDGGTP